MATDQERMLIQVLNDKQASLVLSDSKMAARLGISPAMWCLVKQGKRRISRRVLQGVIRQFPEFTSEAIILLRENVATVTIQGYTTSSSTVEAPQSAQEAQESPSELPQVS